MRYLIPITTLAIVAPAAAQTAKTTVQQDFQAATDLFDAGKHAEALAAWEALEKRTANNRRTRAIIRVRKAAALSKLNRFDEAVVAARSGLAELPAGDATLREDRYSALMTVGLAAFDELDYASAAGSYREAEQLAPSGAHRLTALLQLLRSETFVDPQAALATLGRLEANVASQNVDLSSQGLVKTAASELYLNLGRFAEARTAARDAVKLLGGMTLRVNYADIAARSDAAIASLKLGDDEEARRYLAYTGAGRSTRGSFNRAIEVVPPDCGGEAGIKPDDVAVIEFSVNGDGAVVDSLPVYSSGTGEVALAFARAARQWS